ncbi:unnamed protein product [Blepharisma stoltei]|uniref:Uncharacterized protein n=1 Tax=Blepharisma stoltei TaxID=1481888 RepID=A0AAU9IE93_9CILI|nr:unnamed protein product [Blepharisma stoltei]
MTIKTKINHKWDSLRNWRRRTFGVSQRMLLFDFLISFVTNGECFIADLPSNFMTLRKLSSDNFASVLSFELIRN